MINFLVRKKSLLLSALDSAHLIQQLCERGLITADESAIMRAATGDQAFSLPISTAMKDAQRARILRCMLMEVARKGHAANA